LQHVDKFWTVSLGFLGPGCVFFMFVAQELGPRRPSAEILVHERIGVKFKMKTILLSNVKFHRRLIISLEHPIISTHTLYELLVLGQYGTKSTLNRGKKEHITHNT
jgi:hypothetical protein